MTDLSEAVQGVKDFSWWNYGLDEVSETQSDDWAHALVDEIAPLIIAAHIASSSVGGTTTSSEEQA